MQDVSGTETLSIATEWSVVVFYSLINKNTGLSVIRGLKYEASLLVDPDNVINDLQKHTALSVVGRLVKLSGVVSNLSL